MHIAHLILCVLSVSLVQSFTSSHSHCLTHSGKRRSLSPSIRAISQFKSGSVSINGLIEAPTKKAMSTQPLFSGLASILLNLVHIIRILLLDPLQWLLSSIRSSHKTLSGFYGGKTVLITGASSGLGRELALNVAALSTAEAPVKLVLSARNVDSLESVRKACKEMYPSAKVMPVPVDLLEIGTSVEKANAYQIEVYRALREQGLEDSIDILINNAGVSSRGTALETTLQSLSDVMNVNFYGTVAVTKAFLPNMMRGAELGKRAIGVVSSVQGRLGIPLRTSYSASKHAVQGYFDSLRGELSKMGISVSVISPGYINTALSDNAVTSNGTRYGKTDASTASGMDPAVAAKETLLAIAKKQTDFILAEAKVSAAIQARSQFPQFIHKMTGKRMSQ